MKKRKVLVLAFSALITVFTVIGSLTTNNTQALERAVDDSKYTVGGVSPQGTTINVFDYWLDEKDAADNNNPEGYLDSGINKSHELKFGKNMAKDPNNTNEINHWTHSFTPKEGIVNSKLGLDGYPQLSNAYGSESLSYLFNAKSMDGKKAYMDVNGLLQVDFDGYYYYNSQKNFAQFNENTKDFTLYNDWAVKTGGSSPNGQFFPFNQGDQVFNENGDILTQKNIISTNQNINHYFGLSMSTRFVQRYGGHTDENETKEVTYNFSGDDDVWIFIDNVLVGDLGGIHDKASIEINFATGKVVIYNDKNNDNVYNNNDTEYKNYTLADLLQGTGVKLDDTTLADDTYHTLNFFYLERGNVDSNMSLKYNLVTMPETDIVKVDAEGDPVGGIEFQLISADENYNALQPQTIYEATTENDGKVVFLDNNNGNELPLQLETMKDISNYWILREVGDSSGYRTSKDAHLYFTGDPDKGYLLLSNNIWDTGTYAQPKVLSSAGNNLTIEGNNQKVNASDGQIYAVPQKKIDGKWISLVGDNLTGWKTEENITEAVRQNGYRFVLGSSGAYECIIDEIPGDVTQYEYMGGNTYRMAYYYVGNDGEVKGRITEGIERQFSARLYVSNISNALVVQKQDYNDNPITEETADFTLYSENDVTADGQGNVTVNPDAEGTTKTTGNLTSPLNIQSSVVFDNLKKGTYYLAETKAPEGYRQNTTLTKVIVNDQGVYADAGSADDGVAVSRGVGRILKSVSQFATNDVISSTLHDIIATLQTLEEGSKWSDTDQQLHLQYGNDGKHLEYGPYEEGGKVFFTVDEGWSNVKVEQCSKHGSDSSKENLEGQDITSLFTGSIVVAYQDPKEVSLEGTKILDGEDWPGNSSFTFELKTNDENTIQAIKDGDVLLEKEDEETKIDVPDGEKEVLVDSCTVVNDEYKDKEDVDFKFNNLILKKYGTYKFTVNEKAETLESIQYSKAQYDVEINYQNDGVQITKTQTRDDEGTDSTKPNADIIFTNKFVEEGVLEGKDSLTVKKVLNGRDWKEGDLFTFTLEACDETTKEAVKNLDVILPENAKGITITNTSDLKQASFGDIRFKKEGDYVFTIKETNGDIAGITYDDSVYKVIVKVTDDGKGILKASEPEIVKGKMEQDKFVEDEDQSDVNGVVFNNGYTPTQGSVVPVTLTKTLSGKELTEGEFTFKIQLTEGDKEGVNLPESTQVSNDADGKVQFGNIVFTKAGEYEVTMQEVIPEDATENEDGTYTFNGVTYDTHKVVVTYTVTDKDGQLQVEPKKVDGETEFKNKYSSSGSTENVDLVVTKTLTGRDWKENDEFTFTLKAYDENTKNAIENGWIVLPENAAGLKISYDNNTKQGQFGDIQVTKAGSYIFVVEEEKPEDSLPGVSYDTSKKYVILDAEDQGNGKIKITTSIKNEPSTDSENTDLSFTNTYTPTSFTDVPEKFSFSKVLTGREWTDEDSFSFTLEGLDNAPMPEGSDGQFKTIDVTKENAENFNFGAITYTKPGSYKYKVSENKPDTTNGIQYDSHVSEITVVVEDTGNGKLSAVAQTKTNTTFTNTYTTTEVDYDVSPGLQIVKNMTGQAIEENDFTFTMSGTDKDSIARLNDGKPLTVSTKGGALTGNTSTEVIRLTAGLLFTKEDAGKTYTYTVKENIPEDAVDHVLNGVTYDAKEYTVAFKVTEDGKGMLSVETFVDGVSQGITQGNVSENALPAQLVFNNSYQAEPTTVGAEAEASIQAHKVLNNASISNYDGAFHFNVTGTNNAVVSTGTNDGNGLITFSDIHYTTSNLNDAISESGSAEVGKASVTRTETEDVYTFKYTVSETGTLPEGVSIVKGSFNVTVTVTDDHLGHLSAVVTYDSGNALEFVNTYGYGQSTELYLKGNKVIAAKDGLMPPTLTGGEYQFTITGSQGAPLPETTTVTNQGSNIEFGPITYTMENVFGDSVNTDENTENLQSTKRTKVFTYTITESGSLPGVINDTTIKTVEVTVTDRGDGTIEAAVTKVSEGAVPGNDFTFVNTYNVTPTSPTSPSDFAVTIKKELEGQNLDSGEFTFQIKDGNGNVVSEAQNDENGNVVFPGITFDTVGVYKYTISELNTGVDGFTYDTAIYDAVANVTDNGDGTLNVEWTVTKNQTVIDSITFKNTYKPISNANIQIAGIKKLEGQSLKDGQFTFELRDDEGNVVETATNDENGKINFKEISFDKAGTYHYTLQEVNDKQTNIKYDESVYEIVVQVEDDQVGHLLVTKCDITKEGKESTIVFTNEYQENEQPGKEPNKPSENNGGSDTSENTNTGIFISLLGSAISLMGILFIWRKRSI